MNYKSNIFLNENYKNKEKNYEFLYIIQNKQLSASFVFLNINPKSF